jgi:hypothetical protein
MLRKLINRRFSRGSEKSSRGARERLDRPVLERLEDRQMMSASGNVTVDYAPGCGVYLYGMDATVKGHNGHGHRLTGAI